MTATKNLKPIDSSGDRPVGSRSVSDRIAAGKALRQTVKRSDHAAYHPPANREDPIAILEAQAENRVADLVPIRYARMLASPFAFLRGSAAVMIQDIAPAPTTGLTVQACGDMHVSNFGVFASAERSLVFAINDFDETYVGAWEWDLKRLVASAVVAGQFLGAIACCAKPLSEQWCSPIVNTYTSMRQWAISTCGMPTLPKPICSKHCPLNLTKKPPKF